ncbi:MAG: diphosphomevalonate/mevalonate 3,5-bisphosphate decarboxylase family protein [Candidatus Helarchaeota archaeon]
MNDIIPNNVKSQLKADYFELLEFIKRSGYSIKPIPKNLNGINSSGEAFSIAYSIQGLLKYHGLADSNQRIAYFPSISLNNDSTFTITYLKFDKSLSEDIVILNGKREKKEKYLRIIKVLDTIRSNSKINTKALIISRNFLKIRNDNGREEIIDAIGKGLGTSASGGAALIKSAISIIYDNHSEYINNDRLLSTFSRYLAGSASRSIVGGIGLWLSSPGIDTFDSFAIRLDNESHKSFIEDIALITIPITSNIITDEIHKSSVNSPFYISWALDRKNKIYEFIDAINKHDLNIIGEITEYDSICLFTITLTAYKERKKRIYTWNSDTYKIIEHIKNLSNVYYSIDTGPSIVLITRKRNVNRVYKAIKELNSNYILSIGKIGGPAQIIEENSKEAKLLKEDIEKFSK